MNSILVVFTGGTIGSLAVDGEISPQNSQNYQLIEQFKQSSSVNHAVKFTYISPLQILSENIIASIWETLIQAIEAENPTLYDGIIVTHGTDTLAFTAAALSLYFNNLTIPLLLVSSNYPLNHSQANGLIHFQTAVAFIQQRQQAGVFVPYQNPQSEILIHLGARLLSCLPLSSDFISLQSKAYLQYKKGIFSEITALTETCQTLQLKPHFSSRILLIKPYPAIDYRNFCLDNVDVVLHDLYHSGTACASLEWGEEYSLFSLITRCRQKNIPLFIAPVMKSDAIYQSLSILMEHGIHIVWNMSLETAYAKLLLAYGNYQTEPQIRRFLDNNIAFERINNPY